MGNSIDMSKYNIRTDLIVEEIDTKDIKSYERIEDNITITTIDVDKSQEKIINKKRGKYITISFEDVTDYENKEKVQKVFEEELKKMLDFKKINDNNTVLLIGLGNDKSTPDSLGPKVIDEILVTRHLYKIEGNQIEEGFRETSAINPGVMGETGIETAEFILSLVQNIKPDFLIIIDALAASAISRVNRTIQMTDSGINPGSGVGNKRKEISNLTVGIPVIAIGIPTVVDAVTIVADTFKYIIENFSFRKYHMDNPILKLSPNVNYLKMKYKEITKEEKNRFLGMFGTLSDFEIRDVINDVLTPIGYNMMVTPKEIDFVIEKLANIISSGINNTIHKKVSNF